MSEAIPCPKCGGGESRVKDSRPMNGYVRRRRVCGSCKFRFNTHEVAGDSPLPDVERLAKRLGKAHEAAERLLKEAEHVKVLTQ